MLQAVLRSSSVSVCDNIICLMYILLYHHLHSAVMLNFVKGRSCALKRHGIVCAFKDCRFECSALDWVHCWSSITVSIRSYSNRRVIFCIPKGSLSTCLPTQAIALQTRRWRRLSWIKALVRSTVST